MAQGAPRPIRPLPGTPAPEAERGLDTALTTRIILVGTIVLGQLFALTVALEAYLLDHDFEAWLLAGFSLLSFVVVLVLTQVDPPPRGRRSRGRGRTAERGYVPRPVGEEGRARSARPEPRS